ncbi:hypothetical protein ERJ75_000067900 [Trypanosoma vivax]|nr:hypothetical protein ERJ75_001718700 [Trypanosoma vivax]KAH8605343.1 hypothetical protein ERJ75_001626400 [Trypanosoma vivax]KAH8605347.1 hypothetical protein ERJ75_001625600 [Trypanosoma vivax]KAH8615647.1 hypothetical protein ERJ75_000563900 [Trypanosoma vivax]KAH8615656.1 hypothetical protein ERJ75_000562600 [Trypanosoma vivax]
MPVLRKGSLAVLSQSRFVLEIVNQASLCACAPREISVPTELALGHLRCRVTDMPPQPNSPSGRCLETRLRALQERNAFAQRGRTAGLPTRAHRRAAAPRARGREGAPGQDGAPPADGAPRGLTIR